MSDARFDVMIVTGRRTLLDVKGFAIPQGTVTFLFGESGIGKSLLTRAIYGLPEESGLRVFVNSERYDRYREGADALGRRTNGFFMFQEPSSHLNPLLRLNEQIREGALATAPSPERTVQELWREAEARSVDGILDVYPKPYRPSGGEKQRILAAMAFAKMDAVAARPAGSPGLFVFDEPTGSLDREARDRFLDRLFARFRRRNETVLLVTHDYGMIGHIESHHRDLLPRFSFQELVLSNGKVRAQTFEPQRFLDWLGAQQPEPPAPPRAPFLRIESGIKVFGRTLRFSGSSAESADFLVRPGELAYLKAGSGVGKTTVAKIIIGLQHATYFRMDIDGTRVGEVSPRSYWRQVLWGKKMTMAFQHADEALNPHATVEKTLRIVPASKLRSRDGTRDALNLLFDPEEVPRLLTSKVWQLSGGQKQRLNLLRAFALSTPLIILDEPLSALDFESISRVLFLMREARKRGQAILLISHNEDIFDSLVSPSSVFHLESDAA